MLGLGISVPSLAGSSVNSIVSNNKGAKAAIANLWIRAGYLAEKEAYDCMVEAMSELGCDTIYNYANSIYNQTIDRAGTGYFAEAKSCFSESLSNLLRAGSVFDPKYDFAKSVYEKTKARAGSGYFAEGEDCFIDSIMLLNA